MPTFMLHRRSWNKYIAPTVLSQPETQVDVFEIHEEPIIKSANLLECRSPHEDTRAAQPTGVALSGIVSGLVVAPRPRIGWREVSEKCVTNPQSQRGNCSSRWVDGAVRITNPRSQRTDSRISLANTHKFVERARIQYKIRVDDENPANIGIERCDAGVDAATVSRIIGTGKYACIRALQRRGKFRVTARNIVDHDDVDLVRSRARNRLEQFADSLARTE